MTTIAELPREERPRERLALHGEGALSLTELLAICLGTGTLGKSVLRLAEELLAHFGSLQNLLAADLPELTALPGIGEAKAAQLKAIFALAKRASRCSGAAKFPIKRPADAYSFLSLEYHGATQEECTILLRDIKGNLFHHQTVAIGILSAVHVHPRDLLKIALQHGASSFIVAHNHPSGDPTPSEVDIETTRAIESAGKLMGVRLDDHLIIGQGTFVSLWERKIISKRSSY